MARQRFIWPTIWDDPDLGRVPEAAMLLYIACFSNADDDGRLLGDPAYLRSIAFRYRDVTLETVIDLRGQLEAACKSFRVYTHDGTEFIWFANWDEFQRPKYPRPSKLPTPPGFKRKGRKATAQEEKASRNGSPNVPPTLEEASRSGYPMGRVGQGRVGLGLKAVTELRDVGPQPPNAQGLPFAQELQITKILEHIGTHADEGTSAVVRKHALHLTEASLAKVLESSQRAKPKNRAGYIVAALKDEIQAATGDAA